MDDALSSGDGMNYDRILESLAGETVNIQDGDGKFAGVLRVWTSPAGIDAWLVGGPDGIEGDGPWVIFGSDSVEEISISPHRTIISLNK